MRLRSKGAWRSCGADAAIGQQSKGLTPRENRILTARAFRVFPPLPEQEPSRELQSPGLSRLTHLPVPFPAVRHREVPLAAVRFLASLLAGRRGPGA